MAHGIISGLIVGTSLVVVAWLALKGHEAAAGAMISALAASVIFFLANKYPPRIVSGLREAE